MTVRPLRPNRLAVLLAVISLAVAGSVAWAAIPASDGSFHACANPNSGVLRLIDTEDGENCNPNESDVTWNQTGPPGLSGYEQVEGPEVFVDHLNPFDSSTATCPVGTKVLGGGWQAGGVVAPAVFDSHAVGEDSWRVRLENEGVGLIAFKAVATCASVAP